MSFFYLIAYWYTYSKWYILGSIFVTHILNTAFKKLWLSPLLVNAASLLILAFGIYIKLIAKNQVIISVISIYLPVVFTSIVLNIMIFIYKKIKKKIKNI